MLPKITFLTTLFPKSLLRLSMLAAAALMMGCASSGGQKAQTVVLATPLQVNYQSEMALAKLGQMINSGEYNQEQSAQLYYERGLVFDRVGLRALARFDFNRAIQLKPNFPEAYNFLGVYYTVTEEFDSAFEAFDSAIELAPDYGFAYFYRSVALSYANKPELAITDIDTYALQDLQDPYRVMWRYMIKRQLNEQQAKQELADALAEYGNTDWGWDIVRMFNGDYQEDEFLALNVSFAGDNRQLAERLCEAYFYLGKQAQQRGEHELARSLFKLSIANNVYDFVEHRFALFELARYEAASS